MLASVVPLYQLTPHGDESELRAAYYRDDGTIQYFGMSPIEDSSRLVERLRPVAGLWAHKVRQAHDGINYQVVSIGNEDLKDDIYVVCLPQDKASTDLRCWPLNEFERLRNPPS